MGEYPQAIPVIPLGSCNLGASPRARVEDSGIVLAVDSLSSPLHAPKKNGASLGSSGELAALEAAEFCASSGTDAGSYLVCSLPGHACLLEPFFVGGEHGCRGCISVCASRGQHLGHSCWCSQAAGGCMELWYCQLQSDCPSSTCSSVLLLWPLQKCRNVVCGVVVAPRSQLLVPSPRGVKFPEDLEKLLGVSSV